MPARSTLAATALEILRFMTELEQLKRIAERAAPSGAER
jgi:hypothetical protein